ncbi:MAG: peptidylprolyl isomerase [Oscillospiraceae bacterium]|jgi:peptidyl-prolyl cis-trans isomerase A (cyclophilin A)/peptidyl-prolyl cis-trans isomerase B (cyclophilin B)|nr:peptidylprolyl isomerase [Oscillospiraceae bacterium]
MKLRRIIASILSLSFLAACAKDSGESGVSVSTPESDTAGNVGEVKLEKGDTYTVISVKDFGDITIKLYPAAAPVAVQNFIDLANSGYYTGKKFHRVVSDFMIQGGSADGTGVAAEGEKSFDVELYNNMRHFYGAFCMANAAGKNGTQFYIVNSRDKETYGTALANAEYLAEQAESLKKELDLAASGAEGFENVDPRVIEYYTAQYETWMNTIAYVNSISPEAIVKYSEVGGTAPLDGGYTVFGQTVDGFDVLDKVSAVPVHVGSSGEESTPDTDVLIDKVVILVK